MSSASLSLDQTNSSVEADPFASLPIDESSPYKTLIDEAHKLDFADLERSHCVSIRKISNGTTIIIFIPRLGFQVLESTSTSSSSSSETIKKILLYFIKTVNDIIMSEKYILIYGHTPMSIISQQSVIYKYYKILPRPYKKNLSQLIIVHPQLGIKLLFEFVKVFVSQKFFSKLLLVDSIFDLQQIHSPCDLLVPYKFIKYEDEDFDFKYLGTIPSLIESFVPILGTTKLLADCVSYLRYNGGFDRVGIFRIPGDENILTLAKIRMQRMYSFVSPGLPIIHDRIVIGIESMTPENDPSSVTAAEAPSSSSSTRKKTLTETIFGFSSSSSSSEKVPAPPTVPAASTPSSSSRQSTGSKSSTVSIAVFNDLDTVAQILKFSLRELSEPLVTFEAFDQLVDVTKKCKAVCLSYMQRFIFDG